MNDASTKWVYGFGAAGADGDSDMRNLLGGKGANLAEMSGIGLPVPPGFTITTEVCTYYYDHERSYPDALLAQVDAAIAQIENERGVMPCVGRPHAGAVGAAAAGPPLCLEVVDPDRL